MLRMIVVDASVLANALAESLGCELDRGRRLAAATGPPRPALTAPTRHEGRTPIRWRIAGRVLLHYYKRLGHVVDDERRRVAHVPWVADR